MLLHGSHTDGNQWKTGCSYTYNRENILKNKDCKKGQRRALTMIKEPTQQENVTFVSIYDPK